MKNIRMKNIITTIFLALFAFFMIIVVLRFFPVGDPHLPGYADFVSTKMPFQEVPERGVSVALRYSRQSVRDVGATSVVVATILDYRGYDTLYETIVLFTAAVAVLAVIGKDDDHA